MIDSKNPGKKWNTFLSEFPRRRGRITKHPEEGATWRFEERKVWVIYKIGKERAYKGSIFLMRLKSGRAFL